jgi:hypothetical protein
MHIPPKNLFQAGLQSYFNYLLTTARKALTLCLSAAVGMSAGYAYMARRAAVLLIVFAVACRTGHSRILLGLTAACTVTAVAPLRRKAPAACLRRTLRLRTVDLNICAFTAAILIVGTVYHIAIKFSHYTYLLFLFRR